MHECLRCLLPLPCQENGVLKRRVTSAHPSSSLGDQATIVLGQYEEDIQHLKVGHHRNIQHFVIH